MSHKAVITPIKEWLIDCALDNKDIVELYETLCLKIAAVGIPVTRGRLFWPTLHPLFQAETVSWNQGGKAVLKQFVHEEQASISWNRSPLKYVQDNSLHQFRRALTGLNVLKDFEILQELSDEGFTDYFLLSTQLGGSSFIDKVRVFSRGIVVTWATDNPRGFSDEDLVALQNLQRRFAITCKNIIQSRIAHNIATTYLGSTAGERVLDGQIRRGDGSTTQAVVWFSDLRNSTKLTEIMPSEEYFDLLNAYFMSAAEPVVQAGGEILDFIGDAVLGIFPFADNSELPRAACAANRALDATIKSAFEINQLRQNQGMRTFKFGIGLNIGEVKFGNIGIPSRLSFSVIGPAVNQGARIENMTKELKMPILADANFAKIEPDKWRSVGEHSLRGVSESTELYAYNCPNIFREESDLA